MICVKITLIQISTQNIIARHPLAFKGLRGKRPKKWDNSAEKCGEKKGMMFHVKQSAQQASYLSVRRLRQTSVSPLLRLFPPQPLRWVASEKGNTEKKTPECFT